MLFGQASSTMLGIRWAQAGHSRLAQSLTSCMLAAVMSPCVSGLGSGGSSRHGITLSFVSSHPGP